MASAWYPAGVAVAVKAGIDWDDGNVKMSLINTGTSYNNAHDYWSDISAGAIGTPIALATVTVVAAANVLTFDAADTGLTWAAVAVGSTVVAVAVYYDTGNPATSPLLTWNEVTSTPTNGGDITITINASGIGTITC